MVEDRPPTSHTLKKSQKEDVVQATPQKDRPSKQRLERQPTPNLLL